MVFVRVSSDLVSLAPPSDDELEWILASLADPAIYRALGWEEGIGSEVYSGYIEGSVIFLPFRRKKTGQTIGFIMLVATDEEKKRWSVNIAIPDKSNRDKVTALAACDALSHLMFDLEQNEGLEWRIEPSNVASRALPQRLGYPKIGEVVQDGTTYETYGIGVADWAARQEAEAFVFEDEPIDPSQIAHWRVISAVRGKA